jgi:hypothetical protein
MGGACIKHGGQEFEEGGGEVRERYALKTKT